jgi:hypothetical protein
MTTIFKLQSRGLSFVILIVLLQSVCSFCQFPNKKTTDNQNDTIQVIFHIEPDMFPFSWTTGEINGKARSLDSSEYERSFRILERAMSKYPEGFLNQYLDKIYVVEYLEFFGVEYGGTNTDRIVYMANSGEISGYTDLYLEQTFHHELSSILFYEHPEFFNERKWKQQNHGFDYGDGGVSAIQNDVASTEISHEYATLGVLSQYATSALEEDFNTFAEQLFCASQEFWKLVDTSPLLYEKAKIIIDFYTKLNPVFTEAYFREISTQNLR